MGKIFKYLLPYWKTALLAPILMIIEVVMDLMQPLFMARIIDIGVAGGDVSFIVNNGLRMVGIAIVGIAGGIGCVILSNITAQNFANDLRSAIFSKIQSFSFADLDKFNTGSLITRLTNDVSQIQMVLAMMMRLMVRAPLLFIGGLIMAFSINVNMALILIATIPFLVLVITLLILNSFKLFGLAQQKLDRVNVVLQENLAGVRVVKAFNRADYETNRFKVAVEDHMENMIKVARISSIAMPGVMLIMNIAIIAVIWLGGLYIRTDALQVGQVMAFITYAGQILFSMAMMAMVLMFVSRAKASGDRIIEVLKIEPSISSLANAEDKQVDDWSVDFKDVSFGYGGCEQPMVIKNLSLRVNSGETLAILGTTGSGKSTLINLIPRLYEACTGSVSVGKKDVRELSTDYLRKSISIVLQETIILSGTIKENIKFGNKRATDEEVVEAAKIAQIHDFIDNLPEKYDTVLGQHGVNLSGGQKQRISIARAILKKPKILILDDSTSAVDLETEAKIKTAIRKFCVSTTCIIVAQRISSVIDADKIIVIDEGRLVAHGKHNYLLESNQLYKDIYYSQNEEAVS